MKARRCSLDFDSFYVFFSVSRRGLSRRFFASIAPRGSDVDSKSSTREIAVGKRGRSVSNARVSRNAFETSGSLRCRLFSKREGKKTQARKVAPFASLAEPERKSFFFPHPALSFSLFPMLLLFTTLQSTQVAVQLPMFNERAVCQAIIDSACEMAWPRERFCVQVRRFC